MIMKRIKIAKKCTVSTVLALSLASTPYINAMHYATDKQSMLSDKITQKLLSASTDDLRSSLFEAWLNSYGINEQDSDGNTLLMKAIEKNNVSLTEMLLVCGAQCTIANNEGTTPLMVAAAQDNIRLAQLLFDYAENMQIDQVNKNNETALMIAVKNDNSRLVKLLLNKQVDVNKKDNQNRTAFRIALENYRSEVAQLLMDHGADIVTEPVENTSSLMLAINNNNINIAQALLRDGVDVNKAEAFTT